MSLQVPTEPHRVLEELLATLFRPDQLRRTLALEFGEKVVRQLPGETVSAEAFNHEAVRILMRNGLVDQGLFAALLRDRQWSRDEISRVAALFGVTLSSAEVQRVVDGPVTLSDRVIDDIYDDLKMQQGLVRDFLGGPWAKLNAARLTGTTDPGGVEREGAACRAWAAEQYRRVTHTEVRQALEVLRLTTVFNPARGGIELGIALITIQTWGPAIQTLEQFSKLPPDALWQLANKGLARR